MLKAIAVSPESRRRLKSENGFFTDEAMTEKEGVDGRFVELNLRPNFRPQ
jgi:hypothetical protein